MAVECRIRRVETALIRASLAIAFATAAPNISSSWIAIGRVGRHFILADCRGQI
jgi:hypothetical protein